MDSMRSLNTSLPGTSPPKNTAEPPEQLLSAFKAAALSVTKLYKTAAIDQTRARNEGYQDALDDLLSFLDKGNLGLGDGEGWKIRRWATERLDGRESAQAESDDETEKPERGSSPVLTRAQASSDIASRTTSPARPDVPATIAEEPIAEEDTLNPPIHIMPPSTDFSFRSSHAYPQEPDMNMVDLELSESRSQSHASHDGTNIGHPRSSRVARRDNRANNRSGSTLGRGAGSKRKVNIADFFDISNLGHGRDGLGGGGKRGKFA